MFTVCQWKVYQNGPKEPSQHVLVIVHIIMFHANHGLISETFTAQKSLFCPCFFPIKGQKEKQGKEETDPCQCTVQTGNFSIPPSCHKLSSHTEGQQGNTQNNLQPSRQSHLWGEVSDFLADFYERRIWGAKSLGKAGVILSKSVCFFCQPLPNSGI